MNASRCDRKIEGQTEKEMVKWDRVFIFHNLGDPYKQGYIRLLNKFVVVSLDL